MIEKLAGAREWIYAGDGFEAKESEVRLAGWSRQRRVIVLRRRVKRRCGALARSTTGAPHNFPSPRSARRRKSTNTRFWSPRSTDDRSLRSALSRSRRRRKYFRRDEEPMGLGRLHDARPRAMPAGGAPAGAGLRLVEHLCASRPTPASIARRSPAGPCFCRPSQRERGTRGKRRSA